MFKDELPPPRYRLEGDGEGDGDHQITLSFDKGQISLDKPKLILLAPRMHPLQHYFGSNELTKFELRSKTSYQSTLDAQHADFYGADPHTDSHDAEQVFKIPVYGGPNGFRTVLLPALSREMDAFLGNELVKQLQPEELILLTPGESFMSAPAFYLQTLNSNAIVPPMFTKAEPPAQVQGAGAAAISCAQRMGISGLVLALNGEGALHHEVFQPAAFVEYKRDVLGYFGLTMMPELRVREEMSHLYM